MKFGYQTMFPETEILTNYNPSDLDQLALMMTGSDEFEEKINDLFISSDKSVERNMAPADFGLPSGYVYLAQFLAHDLTFDSMSDRHTPEHQPWHKIDIENVFNKRNPLLDLELIYGSDSLSNPSEQPREALMASGSKSKLRLGKTFPHEGDATTVKFALDNDLPREETSARPVIVDPRNDENLLVAQTQVAFIKFHNAIVDELGTGDSLDTFETARKIAIRHYLAIIRWDFLPRIVNGGVLAEVEEKVQGGTNTFYRPTDADRYLPLEFVSAAFRFGHSLIRNEYQFNLKHRKATTLPGVVDLFKFTGRGGEINAATSFRLRSSWVINWLWFFDFSKPGEAVDASLNMAEPFDTHLSSALNLLLPKEFGGKGRINSLSALDLYRGVALSLPSGQSVAEVLCPAEKLDQTQIESTFRSKLSPEQRKVFGTDTPLFYYILAEAEIQEGGKRLGQVGSRIVAEVILQLIKDTNRVVLENDNSIAFFGNTNGEFGMTDMLLFIDRHRDPTNHGVSEINPIQEIDWRTGLKK